jgi:hypothetical protein
MINTAVHLTQSEIRYLLEHTNFDPRYDYLRKFLENKLNELIEKEGERS